MFKLKASTKKKNADEKEIDMNLVIPYTPVRTKL